MIFPAYPPRSDRWQSLLHASDHIAYAMRSDGGGSQDANRTALEQVRSLKEIFDRAVDPVVDFEGYAVRQLLKSMEALLALQEKR